MLSWDTTTLVADYPGEGGWTTILETLTGPGGTTANSAVAAARLGGQVALFGAVGADSVGQQFLASLASESLDLDGVRTLDDKPTDQTTLIVSSATGERTILWNRGARMVRGSRIDIPRLFDVDCCLVDTDDYDLTRFLVDLPVHTFPNTRLLGTLTYLETAPEADVLETLFRFDTVVGSMRQLKQVLGIDDQNLALAELQGRITGSNLRQAFVTDGTNGAYGVDAVTVHHCPAFLVATVDTTGAGDAFAGAVAYGMANRWSSGAILRFASGTAALSTTTLGAQTGLPNRETVERFLSSDHDSG